MGIERDSQDINYEAMYTTVEETLVSGNITLQRIRLKPNWMSNAVNVWGPGSS